MENKNVIRAVPFTKDDIAQLAALLDTVRITSAKKPEKNFY